ncbi:MAG: NAD(P)H-hydrate epimerase [Phycisphaeraceae bacterium]|nr:NAD(P)H-hydrate epimerase [Phycisphaeraceae bacterium]
METLSREQVRLLDRIAIDELGIPGAVLMENAGSAVAQVVLNQLKRLPSDAITQNRVAVVCGAGNNGGDGYVVARYLHNAGITVEIFPARDPGELRGDALIFATVAARMGLPLRMIRDEQERKAAPNWETYAVVVDALLGTGFTGSLRPHFRAVIESMNIDRRWTTIAVDVPSGLDCDTGMPAEVTVEADTTVTFVSAKRGFGNKAASQYVGQIVVADIGTPPELVFRVRKALP